MSQEEKWEEQNGCFCKWRCICSKTTILALAIKAQAFWHCLVYEGKVHITGFHLQVVHKATWASAVVKIQYLELVGQNLFPRLSAQERPVLSRQGANFPYMHNDNTDRFAAWPAVRPWGAWRKQSYAEYIPIWTNFKMDIVPVASFKFLLEPLVACWTNVFGEKWFGCSWGLWSFDCWIGWWLQKMLQ